MYAFLSDFSHFSASSMPLFALSPDLSSRLNSISWEALYLVGTFIVGLLIAYQAILLKRNAGKMPEATSFHLSSLLETAWMLVSAAILYFANFSTLPKVIVVAYMLYGIFGWLYSFYLLKDEAFDIDSFSDIENVAMPAKYMDYSLAFSCVIAPISLLFLAQLYRTGAFYLAG